MPSVVNSLVLFTRFDAAALKATIHVPRRLVPFASGALLLMLTFLFWKVHVLDPPQDLRIGAGNGDLFVQATPMAAYGFEALAHGHLPLWNPYQFCGEPFFAVGYVGLLYPLHVMNLWFDVLTSFEIALVLHMFLAAVGMWGLARHLHLSMLGALCAAMTFAWSGYVISTVNLPGVFEAISWMPLTVLLLDLVVEGRRWAWLGLVLALASELLIGLPEYVLHTLVVGAVFVLCRLVQMSWRGQSRAALWGLGVLLVSGVAALLLVTPQLLPVWELTQQSTRGAGALSLAQAVLFAVPPAAFLQQALAPTGVVTVGVLPLIGLVFVFGAREQRLPAVAALIAGTTAALLVFGGPLYRAYYSIPVLGSLFRRPLKFLDIYVFAQAVLVGIAVTQLQQWARTRPGTLWRAPSWCVALAFGAAALGWLAWSGKPLGYWGAMLALLIAFGLPGSPTWRMVMVVSLCAVQGANLFFTARPFDISARPFKQPGTYFSHRVLLDRLKAKLGDGRVYLSSKFHWVPGLMQKQGLIAEMAVSTDYEPLAVARYGAFFDTITPRRANPLFGAPPFFGVYELTPTSRWRLMDLTGTKYFVMQRGEPGDKFMVQHPGRFRPVDEFGSNVRVFERLQVLPRAYYVPRARVVPADGILNELDSPSFDPRREVLLEAPAAQASQPPRAAGANGIARITAYEPERVEIAADVTAAGYLVLDDLYYPGWKAFIGDHEVPIERANYLFRAVRLDPGHSDVRFEYRPASVRIGLWLSGTTAAALVGMMIWTRRRGEKQCEGGLRAAR